MINKLLGATLALLAIPVFAGDLRYTYVEVGYQAIELDDFNVDGDGFGIRGSFALTDVFALGIEIELDEDLTAFGIGARFYFGD